MLYGFNPAMVRRGLLVVALFAGSFGVTLGALHAIDSVKADFQNIGHMVADSLKPQTANLKVARKGDLLVRSDKVRFRRYLDERQNVELWLKRSRNGLVANYNVI